MKNYVEISGRIANDVFSMTTKTGKAMARFTVEVEGEKFSEYIKCLAWEGCAKAIGKLKKGDDVHFEAHIHNSSYEANGEKKYTTDIIVDKVVK